MDVNQIPWGNCPTYLKGQHEGRKGVPTIALEAVIDTNLWFWHWCFGWPGALNDINVWDRSTLLNAILDGSFALIDFVYTINGEVFCVLYFLVDGIYPNLDRFAKTISVPLTLMDAYYVKWQESKRKDAERGFGVWEKKFHSMVHPIQLFHIEDIEYVVGGCICLHNMMVKERLRRDEEEDADYYETVSSNDPQYRYNYNTQPAHVDPDAQAAIAEEDAYFESNAEYIDLDNDVVDLDLRRKAIRAQSMSLNARYLRWRWERLTNVGEHYRLQNAIKHELWNRDHADQDGDAFNTNLIVE